MTIDPNKQYTATFKTSRGEIVCDLFTKDAPKTVNNFVFLAREKFYDGTVFHPNMQRQAVPLLRSEAPLVGTGMELRAAVDAADAVVADKAGVVEELSADYITVMADDGTRNTYRLSKFARSNQGTSFNQKPIVAEGARVEVGQVIADGPSTDNGEMALGKNLLVAFMPWEGHNYEDAIILNQRIVQDDVLTSIHIDEHEVDARDTKLGAEEITRDVPNVWPTRC